jgi:prophage maintenance system killer protein
MHRPGIARVEGDRVILKGTTIEEVEKYHRATLRLCLRIANEKERSRLYEEMWRAEEEKRYEGEHKSTVESIAKRLKFD